MSPTGQNNFLAKLILALFFTVGYALGFPYLIRIGSAVLTFSATMLLFYAYVPALDVMLAARKRDKEFYIINKMSNGKFALYNEKEFFTAHKEFDSLEEARNEFEIFYKKTGAKKNTLKIFV